MVDRVAFDTVRTPVPLIVPKVAAIDDAPLAMLVATPALPSESLTVATFAADELQWTESVMSCIEPSLNVPTAARIRFDPGGIVTADGFTAMVTTAAEVTFKTDDPAIPFRVAVIVVVPTAREVATDPEFTVATAALSESQLTDVVRSCALPSEKFPMAVNRCVVPSATDGLDGLTVIETRAAVLTVKVSETESAFDVAEIAEVPVAFTAVKPWLPTVLLIVATCAFDESQ
jgi:hypothetical protein